MPHRSEILRAIYGEIRKEFPTVADKATVTLEERTHLPGFVVRVTIPIEGVIYVVEQSVDITGPFPWYFTTETCTTGIVEALKNRLPPSKKPLSAMARLDLNLFP